MIGSNGIGVCSRFDWPASAIWISVSLAVCVVLAPIVVIKCMNRKQKDVSGSQLPAIARSDFLQQEVAGEPQEKFDSFIDN